LLEDRIPFRVSKDRNDPFVAQLGEAFVDLRGHAVVAEFDQKIMAVLNGVALGRNQDVPQVVIREMEIAAQGQPRFLAHQSPEIFEITCQIMPAVVEALVGVRSGYDVLDAVFRRHATHFH